MESVKVTVNFVEKADRVELDITEIIKEGTGKDPKKPVYVYELKDLTYPIKTDDYWKNWFMFAFSAFRKIAAEGGANHKIETFATIGTGPGVDAIGAMFCFNDLKKVIVTDLEQYFRTSSGTLIS